MFFVYHQTLVIYWISPLYLTDVATNINMIWRISQVICNIINISNGDMDECSLKCLYFFLLIHDIHTNHSGFSWMIGHQSSNSSDGHQNGIFQIFPGCALTEKSTFLIFYPRPVLAFGYCRCLRLSVCPSVRPSVCAVITCLSAR